MDHGPEDVESFFAVGLVAYLHPLSVGGESSRYKTVIRGWQKGSYILLETPSGEERLPIFAEDRMCTMRFLHDGRACGFGTRVIDCGSTGAMAYARIAWPRQVEMVRIRKQERIQSSVPCAVVLDNGERYEGIITDMSSGGCGVKCNRTPLIKNNEVVALHFTLPDGTVINGVRVIVRNVRGVSSGSLLGCEFHGDDDLLRQDVSFYVTSTLERMRGAPTAGRRALIIDYREDAIRMLRRALHDFDLEVLAAGGLVDACYRMRMSNPLLVFIGNEQVQLPAVELCRIIRSTRGFEKVPIYIYGGDSADLHREAAEAGADDYFPSVAKVGAIRTAVAPRVTVQEQETA